MSNNCVSCKHCDKKEVRFWWCRWVPDGEMSVEDTVNKHLPGCMKVGIIRTMIVPVQHDQEIVCATYGYQGHINNCPTYEA